MINVSDKYIEAIHATSRETDIRGKIVLASGGVINFTSLNVLQGSTSYSNRCLNSDTFTLGSCYIGEFKTTLKTTIDRYSLFGATIIIEHLLKIEEGEWESVPIGTFTISSANRIGEYIEIDSFDNMSLLENKLAIGTSGTPIELLDFICKECKIDSGMTEEMWANLVNTEQVMAFSEASFTTYRDLLSDLSTLVGGFGTVDRYGALIICPFGIETVDTVDDKIRTKSKFEDYKCKYTSVSINVGDTPYYIALDTDDGLNAQLYDNRLAGANSADQVEAMLLNVLEKIKDINYTPCEVEMSINPAYELGDLITFTGYNTDNQNINSYAHSISWSFRSSMQILGVGENGKIANAKTIADKNAAAASAATVKTELKTMVFTNSDDIAIQAGREEILDINFVAIENDIAIPIISGQFVGNVEEPATYKIIYELNGEEIDFQPTDSVYNTGEKTFTFIKSLSNVSYTSSNKLRIYLEAQPITITTQELIKDTTTGEYSLQDVNTTYNGKVTISKFNIEAILQSTNLSFADKWDGNFEIQEKLPEYLETRCVIKVVTEDLNENCNLATQLYMALPTLTEELTEITLTEKGEITVAEVMQCIIDYDAVTYYDAPYKELAGNGSDEGTFGSDGFITYPPGSNYASCAIGYYVQLSDGQSVKISLTSDEQTQLYLMSELTTDTYHFDVVGDNNTIKYTSTGARFWILSFSQSRQNVGAYKITSQIIDDPTGVYIDLIDGHIGEGTGVTEYVYREGDTAEIIANVAPTGKVFNCWKTSNQEISRKETFSFETVFDGEFTATYGETALEAAPCAFIGKFERGLENITFTSLVETDDPSITVQSLSVIYTKDRGHMNSLTSENVDGVNVIKLIPPETMPNGKYEFEVPIEAVNDNIYLNIEITYTLDGTTYKNIYSNIVESHKMNKIAARS